MDQVDRTILAELQADGRLTITELADRVRLTPGPCHRRLRELERSGVITGYRAVVDPAAVGLGFEALVQITLERGDTSTGVVLIRSLLLRGVLGSRLCRCAASTDKRPSAS